MITKTRRQYIEDLKFHRAMRKSMAIQGVTVYVHPNLPKPRGLNRGFVVDWNMAYPFCGRLARVSSYDPTTL